MSSIRPLKEGDQQPIFFLAIYVGAIIHWRSFSWNIGPTEWGELQELRK